MEQVIGFEPMISGFAIRRLWPLGYTCEKLLARAFCIVPLPPAYEACVERCPEPSWALCFVQHTRDGRDDGTRTRYEQLEKLFARRFAFVPKSWYTGRDSNPQSPVSKTGAFAILATHA